MILEKKYEIKVRSIFDQWSHLYFSLVSSSSHVQSVVIRVKYRNCRRTLDVYLLFALWMGQIQSKLIYILVTDGTAIL